MTVQLSPHFTLDEFINSTTAQRNGINNTPSPEVVVALQALVDHVIEPIRVAVNVPITIDSGYRCPILNALIGGQPSSQHQALGGKAAAADLKTPKMTALQLANAILQIKDLPFDQLLLEFHSPSQPTSGWVHVSYSLEGPPRKMVLTIDRSGTRIGLDPKG